MSVKTPQKPWARRGRWIVLAVTLCGLLLPGVTTALLFTAKLFNALPYFLRSFLYKTLIIVMKYPYVYPLLGVVLRLLDFPAARESVVAENTELPL